MTNDSPEIPQLAPTSDNDAVIIANQVVTVVNKYNRNLTHDLKVGLTLTSFGQTVTVNMELASSRIIMPLLQHVSQLYFLLVSLKQENPLEEKKHIGFVEE